MGCPLGVKRVWGTSTTTGSPVFEVCLGKNAVFLLYDGVLLFAFFPAWDAGLGIKAKIFSGKKYADTGNCSDCFMGRNEADRNRIGLFHLMVLGVCPDSACHTAFDAQ